MFEHAYDNVEYRFRHTDPDPLRGLALVQDLLRLPRPPALEATRYDLSFHSGGMGVLDRHAVALDMDLPGWVRSLRLLDAVALDEACGDEEWREDLLWLIEREQDASPRDAAIRFINEARQPFQPECTATSAIFFGRWSNVNDWTVLWQCGSTINLLAYSQG